MPDVTLHWYGNGIKNFLSQNIDWETDTINAALFTSSYSPDQANDSDYSELTGEVDSDSEGYDTGGKALDNTSLTYDSSDIHVTLDADDVTWDPSTITARYVVLYQGADNHLIAYGDFGEDKSSESAEFTIRWDDDGILRARLPS